MGMFNLSNSERIYEISVSICTYEEIIQDLELLLQESWKEERVIFHKFITNEVYKNGLRLLVDLNTIKFKIDNIKETIQTQKTALDKERYYLHNALEFNRSQKRRKLNDDISYLPVVQQSDLYNQ